jgi:pimeloyl-ACP methyl ester carboxylesterase
MQVVLGDAEVFVTSDGSGPPVVLVHSLSFDGDMWAAQRAALSSRHRVITIDLRGHGRTRSQPRAISLEDLADDVAEVLTALGVERAAYVGLSLGGMVGMRLALRHPDRVTALGLLNTSAEPEPDGVRAMYHQANESAHGKGDAAMAEMMLALMFSDPFRAACPEQIAPYRDKLHQVGDPEMRYQVSKAVIGRDSVLAELHAISVSTLVVTSDLDRAILAARGDAIAKEIKSSRLLSIEGAGHMTAVEKPALVNAALMELLA